MRSATDVWPGGLGSSSGELGHNLMDHHFRCGANGDFAGHEDRYVYGRRPTGFYIPRFRNLAGDAPRLSARLRLSGQREPSGMGARRRRARRRRRVQGRDGAARSVAHRRHGVRRDAAEPCEPHLDRHGAHGQVGPAGAGDRLRHRRERASDAARHDERHGGDARGGRRPTRSASTTTTIPRAWASTRWARRAWAATRRRRC